MVCIQEKQELSRKLQSAEEYRDKYQQWGADADEMQDFTVQELAKVKHLVCPCLVKHPLVLEFLCFFFSNSISH